MLPPFSQFSTQEIVRTLGTGNHFALGIVLVLLGVVLFILGAAVSDSIHSNRATTDEQIKLSKSA